MSPLKRGVSKETEGQIVTKSEGGSFAVSSYLQRGRAPLPLRVYCTNPNI